VSDASSESGSDCECFPSASCKMLMEVVDEGGDESDASGSFDGEESEGEDWDELERKAKRGKSSSSPELMNILTSASKPMRSGTISTMTIRMTAHERRRRQVVDNMAYCCSILSWMIPFL